MDSREGERKKTDDEQRHRDPSRLRRSIEKYRNPEIELPVYPDEAFFALADEVTTYKRTLLGYDRLYVLWQVVRNVATLSGSVAEVGSYRGGSAYFLAKSLIAFTGREVPIHIFDTFEGHPEGAITSHDSLQSAGRFGGTAYETVRTLLAPFKELTIHKGDVSATLPQLTESHYRLVHIDTDLYQPTALCLDYFGARMCRDGIIVIDDYSAPKCPGVAKAVAEYPMLSADFQVWDMRSDQLLLVKR